MLVLDCSCLLDSLCLFGQQGTTKVAVAMSFLLISNSWMVHSQIHIYFILTVFRNFTLCYVDGFIGQMCHVSKDCFLALKLHPCCFIAFAFIISVLQGMRSVPLIEAFVLADSRFWWLCSFIICLVNMVFISVCHLTHLAQVLLQTGAGPISSDIPVPSVDDLANQIAIVLDFFR